MIKQGFLTVVLALMASMSWAFKPAVAYTDAPKFDSSFNEAVYREGVAPFKAQFGPDLVEKNPSSASQFVDVLSELARQGRSPIVAVGFAYAEALNEVAPQYPDTQFVILDSVVEQPNVQSIVFKEHEGSFVVGALAGMRTESKKLGFIAGINLPFLSRFGCGFAQGAAYIDDDIKTYAAAIATDFSGFSNPDGGAAIADNMINNGIDVIYAAAGGSGNGVYKAASKVPNVYAVGVDSNQNYLHPGTMLTSMVKKVGVAAFQSWDEARKGQWRPGVKALGLAENGVDWQLDIFNRNLVSKKEEKQILKIREAIIEGDIQVADYLSSNSCPAPLLDF